MPYGTLRWSLVRDGTVEREWCTLLCVLRSIAPQNFKCSCFYFASPESVDHGHHQRVKGREVWAGAADLQLASGQAAQHLPSSPEKVSMLASTVNVAGRKYEAQEQYTAAPWKPPLHMEEPVTSREGVSRLWALLSHVTYLQSQMWGQGFCHTKFRTGFFPCPCVDGGGTRL